MGTYKLTNGTFVTFYTNEDAAIFCYLIAPFKGLSFESKVPHILVNKSVCQIIKVQKKLYENKLQGEINRKLLDNYLKEKEDEYHEVFGNTWDDDIPF